VKRSDWAALVLLVVGAVCIAPARAQSTLRVLSSNGVKAVIESQQTLIGRSVGRPLAIEFSTASSLARDIEAGTPFDVAILTPALIETLIEAGHITRESYVEFARAGVGVGARPNTGPHDVSTPAALRGTLLAAESVAFTTGGQSRATIDAAFTRLGIAAEMLPKSLLLGPGEAPGAVAAGRADLVLTLVSEILPVPGIELVGPLPGELQGYISFAAGRSSSARDSNVAEALLRYLAGAELAAELTRFGMEPIARP
jgi:molybdate transport system substrate-binding protein